ncbi:hypothetical protein A1O1_00009 [Capronia coronata CBS 617.96]|uniref:Phytanoyl-CoA dioxygenase n=1 Tax=Capronia coronata CBS 617.96 TaxID=1182541 RepID=W9Z021_9EURO|nr:uncharacterized protein A1O1_00009 [Capronia coronata CBS 617.96]EXJ94891.1 hypothetical protein A1O1_00009 [Capronia coronata CBS 617.96]
MPHSTTEQEQTVNTSKSHGDWRDDLFRDGYVVVKNAIPEQRCQYYIDQMFKWLEKFPFGFKRDDRSTWTPERLPTHMKGGMYHGYRVQHERFMWEARQEPKVLQAFARLWGTDELLASFDGMNFTLPSGTQLPPTEPWPHIDQSPRRKGLQCVQGILNFAPNGIDDGGLLVMKGSHNLMQEFFKIHPDVMDRPTWGPDDWFGFSQDELNWFEERGCEILKVCADPGDLILWDSRTMHFNQVPKSQNLRAIIYACYTPASFASSQDLKTKAELFDQRAGTTHWPHANLHPNVEKKLRLGKEDSAERDRPFEEPEESEIVLKLAGKLAY